MKKLRPALVADADRELWRNVASQYGDAENDKTRSRVLEDFLAFANMNSLHACDTLPLFAALGIRCGLEWSTMDTYTGYLTKPIGASLNPLEKERWRQTRRIIKAAHADSECKGAPCANIGQIQKVLCKLSLKVRQAVAAITYTGARLRDVRRWRRKQMFFSPRRIAVQVRLAKNRRRRSQRKILRLSEPAHKLGLEVDASLLQIQDEKQHSDLEERPFENISITRVNKEIAHACQKLSIVPKLTTYSFRKFYIKGITVFYNYDWPTIIQYTLHTNVNVVQAHYDVKEVEDDDF